MAYVETLTSADLDFGRDLWQMLRRERKFPLQGMFWFFDEQAEDWHLVIATPLVDKAGPKRSYLDLDELTRKKMAANDAQLLKITLISPRDALYQALRSVFSQTASVEGVRLGNTYVSGIRIPEAYLYEVR